MLIAKALSVVEFLNGILFLTIAVILLAGPVQPPPRLLAVLLGGGILGVAASYLTWPRQR